LSPVEISVSMPSALPGGQRADHVVGLDAVDHQQRPAGGAMAAWIGAICARQVVGHRRAVALYSGYQSSRKVLPLASKTTAL
jgi:hypothetical protein